jgi:hypothetical protein
MYSQYLAPHVVKTLEIVTKRRADREAELQRKRAEAEALTRLCALSETVEEGVPERLADLMDELDLHIATLNHEGLLTGFLPVSYRELDELELKYRDALKNQVEQEAYWAKHAVPEGHRDEVKMKNSLSYAESLVEQCRQNYYSRQMRLKQLVEGMKYPRTLDGRHFEPLEKIVEYFAPPERAPSQAAPTSKTAAAVANEDEDA